MGLASGRGEGGGGGELARGIGGGSHKTADIARIPGPLSYSYTREEMGNCGGVGWGDGGG